MRFTVMQIRTGLFALMLVPWYAAPAYAQSLYIQYSNKVAQYDAKTGNTSSLNFIDTYIPLNGGGITVDGDKLYVAYSSYYYDGGILHDDYNTTGVSLYNAISGAIIQPHFVIPSWGTTEGIAVSNNRLYIISGNGGTKAIVGVYNATTGEAINPSLITSLVFPVGIAVSGNRLYVSDRYAKTVGEYDAMTGATINPSLIAGLTFPTGLSIENNQLYVVNWSYQNDTYGNGTIGSYDATTGKAINSALVTALDSPFGLACSNGYLYVSNLVDSTIGKYDAHSGIAAAYPFVGTSEDPMYLAINPSKPGVSLRDLNGNLTIEDGGTAWITGDNPPKMPSLEADYNTDDPSVTVKWDFQVSYTRPNGQKVADDQVHYTSTELTWNISNAYKAAQFFGGDATLTCTVPNQTVPAVHFKILGKSPDPSVCKGFIQSQPNAPYYAYAISKVESYTPRVPGKSRYNQFYRGDGSLSYENEGYPVWGNDGKTSSGIQKIGGFGLFQITGIDGGGSGNIPREQLWNWEENVLGGLQVLESKIPIATQLLAKLSERYPDADPMPLVDTFSPLDATTLTAYNGFQFSIGGVTVAGKKYLWTYSPSNPEGDNWTFRPNTNNYVHKIFKQLD